MNTTTTELVVPVEQVDESASFERSIILDLRQYGTLTARDLERLSSSGRYTHHQHGAAGQKLQELALGPYFAPDVTITTILAALRPLAPCLTRLHLNLSSLDTNVTMTNIILVEALQRQHPKLQHLTLRMAPNRNEAETNDPVVSGEVAMPGDGLARSVARVYCCPSSCSSALQSLNLNGNLIEDAGVHALVDSQMLNTANSSSPGCRWRHLRLAHNQCTSRACEALALLLQMDHYNTTLQSLDLSYNDGIGIEGFNVLVQALQVNTTLRRISWVGCRSLQQ